MVFIFQFVRFVVITTHYITLATTVPEQCRNVREVSHFATSARKSKEETATGDLGEM